VADKGGAGQGSVVGGIAGRYASALFDLATEENAVDAVGATLDGFAALIAGSDDLKALVRNPVFSAEEQVAGVSAVLDRAGLSGLGANFIRLVASKRRLFAIEGMAAAYRALVAEARGVVTAEVTVAEPMSAAARASVTRALSETSGKTVAIAEKVDPAIIGGLVVKMGSRMVDASLRTKLNAMKFAMKEAG
jgi:F-type H+-transporting ATPase subunit delta